MDCWEANASRSVVCRRIAIMIVRVGSSTPASLSHPTVTALCTGTKRFFHLLTYTLKSSSCVALLDVVEKSSIAQNATTTSRSASAVTDGVRPTNTAWNRGWSCGLVTTSDSKQCHTFKNATSQRKGKGDRPLCAQHPAGRSGKRGLSPFPLRKMLIMLQFFSNDPYGSRRIWFQIIHRHQEPDSNGALWNPYCPLTQRN